MTGSRGLQQGVEQPVEQVAAILRPAQGAREHQVVVVPLRARQQPALGLPAAMTAQGIHDGGRELHLAPRPGRLRLADGQARQGAPEGPGDRQGATLEVEVAPAQREQLALAHPRCQSGDDDRLERAAAGRLDEGPRLRRGAVISRRGIRGGSTSWATLRTTSPRRPAWTSAPCRTMCK
jgi:hypothetical protein